MAELEIFQQIVIVDNAGLRNWAVEKLKSFSPNSLKIYSDFPKEKSEIIERIKAADAVFVSPRTKLTSEILQHSENLKYVGMCCSLYDKHSANVDMDFCESKGITVKGIRDYGDVGVVEFIASELIRLLKGLGEHQWKNEPLELIHQKVGIIGLGTSGKMVADILRVFGAQVNYFSRTRKPQAENEGIGYLPLHDLLKESDIISLHLPRNSSVLGEKEFDIFGSGKILINTSLGLVFDKTAFEKWISNKENFAIFDSDGIGVYKQEFEKYRNVISTNVVSGRTKEAYDRLSEKVLKNVEDFWAGN